MYIPTKFHFIWITIPGKKPNGVKTIADMRPETQKIITYWKTLHPDFALKLWTDDDAKELLKRHPKWLKLFTASKNIGERSDILRYLILKSEGGIYVDTDCHAKKNISPIIQAILASGKEIALTQNPVEGITNWIIFSVVGAKFWDALEKDLFDKKFNLSKNIPKLYTLATTGPWLLSGTAKRESEKVFIIDTVKVCVINSCVEQAAKNGAYFVHLPEGSWHNFSLKTKTVQDMVDTPRVSVAIFATVLVAFAFLVYYRYRSKRYKQKQIKHTIQTIRVERAKQKQTIRAKRKQTIRAKQKQNELQ